MSLLGQDNCTCTHAWAQTHFYLQEMQYKTQKVKLACHQMNKHLISSTVPTIQPFSSLNAWTLHHLHTCRHKGLQRLRLQLFPSANKPQAPSVLNSKWEYKHGEVTRQIGRQFEFLRQGVDGFHGRVNLQTCTKVHLPDVSPGSCVLADERAVLVERYLSSFPVVHQTVVARWSLHHCIHVQLASLKPPFLLSAK